MRLMPMAVAISLILATSSPAVAQDEMAAAGANVEAAMAQAQADAIHPGDDLLTCEQMQAEIGATMTSDEVRTNTAEIGASAERQQALAEESRRQQQSMMTTGIVTGVIGSFIPGVGYAQSMAMAAQARQMQQTGAAGQRETAGMMGNMSAMMPQMMRGQRLYELAEAKQCPFIEEMQQQAQQ